MSHANDIALILSSRLQAITVANGYQTDIGLKVMRGRKRLDASHLPCAVLVEKDDKVNSMSNGPRARKAKITQPFVLEGHATCDPDNPNDTGHKIIADIKRAMFSTTMPQGRDGLVYTLDYVGRSIAPREDGIDVVSAAVEVSVEYIETLGEP